MFPFPTTGGWSQLWQTCEQNWGSNVNFEIKQHEQDLGLVSVLITAPQPLG